MVRVPPVEALRAVGEESARYCPFDTPYLDSFEVEVRSWLTIASSSALGPVILALVTEVPLAEHPRRVAADLARRAGARGRGGVRPWRPAERPLAPVETLDAADGVAARARRVLAVISAARVGAQSGGGDSW